MVVWVWLWLGMIGACGSEGAAHARKVVREKHAPEVRALVADDVRRHLVGVEAAGLRVAPGFSVADAAQRATQMRTALRLLTKPPRGIPELIASPRTFTAAIEPSGKVVATDARAESDRMTGFDLGRVFPVVRDALAGRRGYAVDQFPAIELGTEGSVSLLFAAPAQKQGQTVGAVLTGIPLWRLAQRLTKQLQLDHVSEKGAILWVYLYHKERLHHFGTPPDLDSILPSAEVRSSMLAKSPGGATGELVQFGRWYAYGLVPLPILGEQTGALIVRADPL